MYQFEINANRKKIESARAALENAEMNYHRVIEQTKRSTPIVSAKSTIFCKNCARKSQMRIVKYAKWHWYESPHGCMGGDQWHFGGYLITCPKCGNDEKVEKPHKNGSPEKIAEFMVLERMLRFGVECDDVYSKT